MGCDIHAYIDVVHSDEYVTNFCRLSLNRDYTLFAALAGVRSNYSPKFPARGLPLVNSYTVRYDNELAVVEDEDELSRDGYNCLRSSAEKWVASGASKWTNENKTLVTCPDWHSHSYLYLDELKEALKCYKTGEMKAVMAAMKALNGSNPKKTRLVFWFDN